MNEAICPVHGSQLIDIILPAIPVPISLDGVASKPIGEAKIRSCPECFRQIHAAIETFGLRSPWDIAG